jgi:tripartite ATP-independent transporter DctM subunit
MSPEVLTVLLFGALLLAFAAGTPVAFALGGIAMLFGWLLWGPSIFNLITAATLGTMTSFILLAVPLFLFMGQILQPSGMGEAMFRAAHVLAGPLRGGLAVGVIVGCSLMGAMVGIIGAGIMTAGSVALEPMLKRGYDLRLALGSIMAGGGMAMLIPPSIPMIVFSAVTETSLGRMFAGGLVPAAIMIGLFVVYIVVKCWLDPSAGPVLPREERAGTRLKLIAARDGGTALVLIIMVLGAILFGLATPTEAGAIGAIGAVLLSAPYGGLRLGVIWQASLESMTLTGVFVWILIGATVFSNFHLFMGAADMLRSLTLDLGLPPLGVIILMQISMLLLGLIMDEFVIVVICAPLYTPIAVSLGFDPIWFGILMILNMEIAIQTPPYGFALFYLKSVAPPEISMLDIYRSIGPFVTIKLFVLVLCLLVPELVLWLPSRLFD